MVRKVNENRLLDLGGGIIAFHSVVGSYWDLHKWVDGEYYRLGSDYIPLQESKYHHLAMEFEGDIIRCFINGEMVFSGSDDSISDHQQSWGYEAGPSKGPGPRSAGGR
jgi:hypothetical protein